jgi:hypothetical protein
VDSLGDGLFVPFAVVYFLRTTGLALLVVGLGLSAASLLALPIAPLAGSLTDRLTPAKVVIAGRRPVRVLQLSAAVWGTSFLLFWALAGVPSGLAVPGVFLAIAVYTAAELIQGPVLNGVAVAAAPEALRGRYMACTSSPGLSARRRRPACSAGCSPRARPGRGSRWPSPARGA